MDPRQPLVTVVVPVYNGERYLKQCLDSLLSQTYRDFTLVISDNASSDGTREICEGYVKADPRVRYHRNRVNIGLYGNFNLLFGMVRTRYVKLASADDFWSATMLADAVEELERDPSVALCYPRAVLVDAEGRVIRHYEKSLALMEDDPAVRFRRVLTELGLVNQLQGVIRTAVLRSMLPLMAQPPADSVFVAALSLHGKILELPKFQYFRRFHEEASSWDRKSESHQARLVSRGGARRIRLATWKSHWGLLRGLFHSPVGLRVKLKLLGLLAQRLAWDRSELLRECRELLWRGDRSTA